MANTSVIICTRNPRQAFLVRVLDSLRNQTLRKENWELLLIDNGSDQILSGQWDLSWHPRSRHVREEMPGLTSARLRGIRESVGDLLVFVDDDNVLADDFLSQALAAIEQHPYLGVIGAGVLEPEFEVDPPAELVPKLIMYAIRTVPATIWSSNPLDYSCLPVGAGLCVTRRIAARYEQLIASLNVTELVDRRELRLFSGGDDLFSWAASAAGQGFGIFPKLRLKHLMLGTRMNKGYFLKLTHDHTYSHGILRYLLTGVLPQRIDIYQYIRLVLNLLKNGKFSAQCQWAWLRGQDGAAQFIADRGLRPLSQSQVGRAD